MENTKKIFRVGLSIFLILGLCYAPSIFAVDEITITTGEILVKYFEDEDVSVIRTPSNTSVTNTIVELEKNPEIEYAEPNYTRSISSMTSNDTFKDILWGLHNTGQTVTGNEGVITGALDSDIDAPEAWTISEGVGGEVIVAVIDIGVDYTHPDLVTNMWDGSNCKDETGVNLGSCNHGYDYASNDTSPLPLNNSATHGTHVAGIIGAEKNNSAGVIGAAPHAKIMALRFALNVSSEVKAIDFAIQNGVKVINASYGGSGFSQAEYDAISRFNDAGGIFIAAAGNNGASNEDTHFYPADYDLPNIITVAATDQNDQLATFSNYGAISVDVGAPGTNILSTVPNNNYAYASGTSMAAPYTAGLAALIWGYQNNLSSSQVKSLILDNGDANIDLASVTTSGKRINMHRSLFGADILYAQGLHDSSVEGIVNGEYSAESRTTFQTAITTAASIKNNAASTDGEIAAAASALLVAIQTFIVSEISAPVPDTTPPVITILGDEEVSVSFGEDYEDAGATAEDTIDGDLTSSIVTVNEVNTSGSGTYIITYDVSDLDGNEAVQATRTVIVSARQSSGGGGGGGGGSSRSVPKSETIPSVTVPLDQDFARPLATTNPEGLCPVEQQLSQNLRAPSQNGKYNSYTQGVVTQANILQAHLNRLGFNSGVVDGYIGPLTDGAIKRMQIFLKTTPDGFVGPITRGLLNHSCGSAGLHV